MAGLEKTSILHLLLRLFILAITVETEYVTAKYRIYDVRKAVNLYAFSRSKIFWSES